MRCRAALSCRFPVRVIRTRPAVLPDHTGMGATPAWRANFASVVNLVIPAASPTSFAAVNAPQPGNAIRVGAVCSASRVIRCCNCLVRRVNSMMSARSSRASSATIPDSVSSQSRSRFWCLGRSSDRGFGAFPESSSWTRHNRLLIVAVRCPTRVSRRSTNSFNSRDTSLWDAMGRSGSRRNARATASASIGSDFPRVRADARTCAIIFGGTRTTGCPAVSRSRSSRADRCRQSSIAHVSPSPNCVLAHDRALPCSGVVASTVSCPSCFPTSSTATNVWVRLCTSAPTTTMMVASFTGQ